VRGFAGLAQRIEAVLRRTRGCGGESRKLEDDPGAAIQFRQGERHGRPFGGQLDLRTGSHVGGAGDGELLAVSAEYDWRLRRRSGRTSSASPERPSTEPASCSWTTRSARTTGSAGTGSGSSARTCAASAAEPATGRGKTQTPDVALAHGSVPGGLDLTGVRVDGDAVVDAVVNEHVGIG